MPTGVLTFLLYIWTEEDGFVYIVTERDGSFFKKDYFMGSK